MVHRVIHPDQICSGIGISINASRSSSTAGKADNTKPIGMEVCNWIQLVVIPTERYGATGGAPIAASLAPPLGAGSVPRLARQASRSVSVPTGASTYKNGSFGRYGGSGAANHGCRFLTSYPLVTHRSSGGTSDGTAHSNVLYRRLSPTNSATRQTVALCHLGPSKMDTGWEAAPNTQSPTTVLVAAATVLGGNGMLDAV
jgi:hypothetical protein